MKKIIAILFFLFTIRFLIGGNYSGEFLENGVSSRNLAMGTSCGALDKTNTAFLSNPAGLAYLKDINLNLMYMDQFGLAQYNYLGTGFSIKENTVVAFNWVRYNVLDIPRRPDLFLSGDYTEEERKKEILANKGLGYGRFNNAENAFFISFARMMHYDMFLDWMFKNLRIQIPVGANLKMIQKRTDQAKAYGLGADVGFRIRFKFGEISSNNIGNVSFGLTLQDFTTTPVYWDTQHLDKIKPNIKTAFSFEQPFKFLESNLSLTVENNSRYKEKARFGAEYNIKNIIALRGGHNFNGFTYGCGLYFKFFNIYTNINYAFLNHEMGNCHRIGLALWL